MSGNHFIMTGGWGPRAESPAEIAGKFLQNLDALSALSPHFQPWEVVDRGDKLRETGFPLEQVRSRFAEIVEHGVSKDDDGDPEPIFGYRVSAFNLEISDPFSVCLKVCAGGTSTLNSVQFVTAYDVTPDSSIVTFPIWRAALSSLVSIWDLSDATVYSNDLRAYWRKSPGRRQYDPCWMTYLSAPLAAQITPPDDVAVERMEGGGILMIAAEDTFDVANPKHMKASQRIMEAMAPFNDAADERGRLRRAQWPVSDADKARMLCDWGAKEVW